MYLFLQRRWQPAVVAAAVLGIALLPGLLGAAPRKPSAPAKKAPIKKAPARKPSVDGNPAKNAADSAVPHFKNVKLLKDLSYQQLIELMRQWNLDLGVECAHCHVVTPETIDYASEAKPTKEVTRQMILLVRDLNSRQKSLEGKATCYMCHHGRAVPLTQAPPYTPPPPPGAAAPLSP